MELFKSVNSALAASIKKREAFLAATDHPLPISICGCFVMTLVASLSTAPRIPSTCHWQTVGKSASAF